MIEVQHLTKRYGRVTAVDDVSFRVERGEILGFLGPNGAGKTTTMRILTGYMPATEGNAIVAGLRRLRPADRGQAPHRLPAGDAAALPRHDASSSTCSSSPRSKACRAASGASASRRSWSARASTTWRTACAASCRRATSQRVGLAQALIHNPDVLILDEPTAGLDPKQIIETRELIKELAGDHTIILSTHILPEVAQTCQRVVIINKGSVVAVDTPDNLTARLRGSETMYCRSTPAGADAAAALQRVPGVTRVVETDRRDGMAGYEIDSERGRDVRRDLARAVVASGWGLLELRADAHEPRGRVPLADHRRSPDAAAARSTPSWSRCPQEK